ncbi:MAG: molybdopterin-binding protein, partial [Chloroflexota bacterium]
ALERSDIVITTGGLGPTVDDVTRSAVADATNRELEVREDLLRQIQDRFDRWGAKMSDNNRRQAYLPEDALAFENPVGTAPSFALEIDAGTVISIPGVPREMTHMMEHYVIPYLQSRQGATHVIVSRFLRTAGIGESKIDSLIDDIERLENPTVGLAAHPGQTDIRVAAKAEDREAALRMIKPVAKEIKRRLGENIYGEGTETIEETVINLCLMRSLTISIMEFNTEKEVQGRLAKNELSSSAVSHLSGHVSFDEISRHLTKVEPSLKPSKALLQTYVEALRQEMGTDIALIVGVFEDSSGNLSGTLAHSVNDSIEVKISNYAGPPAQCAQWIVTLGFDRVRRALLSEKP